MTNIASAASGTTVSPNDDETVNAVQSPALSLVKTASPAAYDAVDDVINYSYLVKNMGNVTLAGPVTVADDKATVTCPAGGLVPGASMTCTASYSITQADLDSGTVKNTAKASANGTDSNTDDETVTADKKPALSLVKTATPATYDTLGQTISYQYVVKNTGNVTLAGPVTVADDKATVTCPAGGLAPDASMTCTASYTITQADLDSGSVTNTAKASANGTDSNTANATVNAVQKPALNVAKSSTTSAITAAGQLVPYTFLVTNIGNVTLSGITVSDPKCDAAPLYQSGDANTDNKLQVTETWTYTCSHTVTQAEIDAGGNLSNTATADSTESAPDTDTQDIPITQSPAILVVKASTTALIAKADDVVPYSFTVTNPGNQTLTGVTLSDPNCTSAISGPSGDTNDDGKLQTGETWTYTCNHTVTQAEVDSKGGGDGDLDNTVTADSNRVRARYRRPRHPDHLRPGAQRGQVLNDIRDHGGRPGGALHLPRHQHRQRHPERHYRQRPEVQRRSGLPVRGRQHRQQAAGHRDLDLHVLAYRDPGRDRCRRQPV